jgi:hypothetical protein
MPHGYIFQDLGELLHYSNDPMVQAGFVVGGQDAPTADLFATDAAIWLPPGTVSGSPAWLKLATGATSFPSSWAHAVSPNLQFIVGYCSNTPDNAQQRACMWIGDPNGGYAFNRLPLPQDVKFTIGNAVSADGYFVAGEALEWNEVPNAAVLWSGLVPN